MECNRNKNFNVVAGLAPSYFIDQTFREIPKIRKRIFCVNGKRFKVKERFWRYKYFFPTLGPSTWNKKVYFNDYKELIKHEIIWVSFKFNPITNQFGKFKSFLRSSGGEVWREI